MHDGPSASPERTASRRRFLGGVVGLTGAALVPHVAGGAAQEATPATGEPVELLFVQAFESGAAEPMTGEGGRSILTLIHGAGQTLYFSDRPERLAGLLETAVFMEELASLASDPPNAALAFRPSDDKPVQLAVMELTEPAIDPGTGTVTYQARMIDPTADGGLTTDDAARVVATLPSTFGQATLFIDGAAIPVGPIPGNHLDHVIAVGNISGKDHEVPIDKDQPSQRPRPKSFQAEAGAGEPERPGVRPCVLCVPGSIANEAAPREAGVQRPERCCRPTLSRRRVW